MEANNNKEFIFKKCQAYKEDFPEIQKDLNIFLNFKGILKYPIESPIDQKIDNQSMLFIDDVFFRNYLQDMPVDYILGKTNFYGIEFNVNYDVLIPRPETELIIDYLIESVGSKSIIVDAGTGSGCIGITAAKKFPSSKVFGIDKSFSALKMAQHNQLELDCKNLYLIQSDWLKCFQGNSIDIILANPPYLRSLDPHLNSLQWEPKNALVSGNTGIESFEELFSQSKSLLKKEGFLVVEHGYEQHRDLVGLANNLNLRVIDSIIDYQKIPRCLVLGT